VLGRNEWVKQRVTEHDLAVICEDQQIRTGVSTPTPPTAERLHSFTASG
jgi:hypothetical protein